MIVICGVDEFPSGPATQSAAAGFADGVGADLRIVAGGPAAQHVAAIRDAAGGVLLFGHAPPRDVAATLRAAPCPVVIAPPGIPAGPWDEVILGPGGEACTEDAAATAGVLAARLEGELRVVVVRPDRRSTGWQAYDGIRRLTAAAEAAAGPELAVVEPEVRAGRPAEQLLRAARERDTSMVVVAADPRPRWLDVLRPSFTAELLHDSRGLVVVVPPDGARLAAPPLARREAPVPRA